MLSVDASVRTASSHVCGHCKLRLVLTASPEYIKVNETYRMSVDCTSVQATKCPTAIA